MNLTDERWCERVLGAVPELTTTTEVCTREAGEVSDSNREEV